MVLVQSRSYQRGCECVAEAPQQTQCSSRADKRDEMANAAVLELDREEGPLLQLIHL